MAMSEQPQPVAGGAPKGGLPLHCLRLPPGDEGPDAAGERGPAPVLPQGPAAAADAADGEEPAGAFSEV